MKYDIFSIQLTETPCDKNHVTNPLEVVLVNRTTNEKFFFRSDENFSDTNNFLNTHMKYFENLFSINGINYWQFMPSYIWPNIYLILELIKILSKIKDTHNPKNITIHETNDYHNKAWVYLILEIFKGCDIDIKKCRPYYKLKNSFFWISLYRIKMRILETYFSIPFFVYKRKIAHRLKSNIIFVSEMNILKEIDGTLKDYRLKNIMEAIDNKNYSVWTLSVPMGCIFYSKRITKNIIKYGKNMIPYFYIFGTKIISPKEWIKIFHLFIKVKKQKKNIEFLGVNIYSLLYCIFKDIIFHYIPMCMRHLKAADKVIKNIAPEKIVLHYETGPAQRAFLIQAMQHKIQTIGLQHGMIFSNHYDYMHFDVSTNNLSKGFIIPTITCVFGDYWKDILIYKGKYNKDNIRTVGDWTKNIKLNSSSKKKEGRISIFTNGLNTIKFLDKIIESMIEYKGIFLVKLHRMENYKEIQNYYRPEKKIVFFQGDINEFLLEASFTICGYSTTVLDSLSYGVQPIIYDVYDTQSFSEYQEIEGVIIVKSGNELKMRINELIKKQNIVDKNKYKNIYACYGKESIRRIVNIIQDNDKNHQPDISQAS
jgi:hypothetical protein